jgi:hypothetical protein
MIKTLKTNGSEDFKVVCQPDYRGDPAGPSFEINFKAYDLLPVPCRKRGTLQFEFELDTDSEQIMLTVRHRKAARGGRYTELGRVEFNLWVPPGSRTLQIWESNEEIEARVNGAFSRTHHPAGGLPDAPPIVGPQPTAPADSPDVGDVEMGGMDAVQVEDDITVATAPAEEFEPQVRCGRSGSRVATGILAVRRPQ